MKEWFDKLKSCCTTKEETPKPNANVFVPVYFPENAELCIPASNASSGSSRQETVPRLKRTIFTKEAFEQNYGRIPKDNNPQQSAQPVSPDKTPKISNTTLAKKNYLLY